MNMLTEAGIHCPYCGEFIHMLIDCSVEQQQYIEDCQVCCRPIVLYAQTDAECNLSVDARHEDEA